MVGLKNNYNTTKLFPFNGEVSREQVSEKIFFPLEILLGRRNKK